MSASTQFGRYALLGFNIAYAVLIILGGGFWLFTGDAFGLFMGIAALACAGGVLMRLRWGYFAAAAWCFGLMRLALDDYSGVYEEHYKRIIMTACFFGVIAALILHEQVAKKPPQENTSNSDNTAEPKTNNKDRSV